MFCINETVLMEGEVFYHNGHDATVHSFNLHLEVTCRVFLIGIPSKLHVYSVAVNTVAQKFSHGDKISQEILPLHLMCDTIYCDILSWPRNFCRV